MRARSRAAWLGALACGAFLSAVRAFAADSAYMKIEADKLAFEGDASEAAHAGWIGLDEVSVSVQSGPKARNPRVAVLKKAETTRDFDTAFKTKARLKTVTIELVAPEGSPAGNPNRPKKLVLHDARVSGAETLPEGGRRVHFSYKGMELTTFGGATTTYGAAAPPSK